MHNHCSGLASIAFLCLINDAMSIMVESAYYINVSFHFFYSLITRIWKPAYDEDILEIKPIFISFNYCALYYVTRSSS